MGSDSVINVGFGLALLLAIFGAFKWVNAEIGRAVEAEAKARHDLANQTQAMTSKLEADLRLVQRDTVRREDMGALEARVTAQFTKMEIQMGRLSEKLEALPVLEGQSKQNGERLEKVLARLDAAGAR